MEEFKEIIWLIGIIGVWMTSYFTTKFQTKQNTQEIKDLNTKINKLDTKVNELNDKCKETISSKDAYASFVSKEMLELHLKTLEQKIDSLTDLIKSRKE